MDAIPLAIELAAARLHMRTLDQVLKRLDDSFNLLTGGLRSSLPRHQTLRATIEWSYNLLSDKERVFFNRLAIFSGGWSLEAAENICSGDGIEAGDVLDLLDRLINKSLVITETTTNRYTSEVSQRYRSLETIQKFGREKLMASTEDRPLRDRHLMYFLNLAEKAHAAIHGPQEFPWIFLLEKEVDNFRSALNWCLAGQNIELGLRLLLGLSSAWNWQGHFDEVEHYFKRLSISPEAMSRLLQLHDNCVTVSRKA